MQLENFDDTWQMLIHSQSLFVGCACLACAALALQFVRYTLHDENIHALVISRAIVLSDESDLELQVYMYIWMSMSWLYVVVDESNK